MNKEEVTSEITATEYDAIEKWLEQLAELEEAEQIMTKHFLGKFNMIDPKPKFRESWVPFEKRPEVKFNKHRNFVKGNKRTGLNGLRVYIPNKHSF